MVEEVVDEVGFGDDVGASIVIGAELALVDELIHVIFAKGDHRCTLNDLHINGHSGGKKPVTPFSTSPPGYFLCFLH